MARGGLEARQQLAKVATAVRMETILQIREKSQKNNEVKARADVDNSDLAMWCDLTSSTSWPSGVHLGYI